VLEWATNERLCVAGAHIGFPGFGMVKRTGDRFAIEADLTPAQIDGLLPGWTKPSGKSPPPLMKPDDAKTRFSFSRATTAAPALLNARLFA
jgi:hypothetical protein